MDGIGSFLKGAVAGVAGLGLLSWFIATHFDAKNEDEEQKEEDPCSH